ncbi:MAG: hypothetical protein ACE5IT_04920 [bacterium]
METKVNLERVKEKVDILMRSKVDYEFKTTVMPAFLNEEDIEETARSIRGAKAIASEARANFRG